MKRGMIIFWTVAIILILFIISQIYCLQPNTQKLHIIQEQLGSEVKKTLMEVEEKITFLSSDIKVYETETNHYFALRNIRYNHLKLEVLEGLSCYDTISNKAKAEIQLDPSIISFETFETMELEAGQAEILPLKIKLKPDATPSVYACKLEVKILEKRDYETGEIIQLDCEGPDCKEDYDTYDFYVIFSDLKEPTEKPRIKTNTFEDIMCIPIKSLF